MKKQFDKTYDEEQHEGVSKEDSNHYVFTPSSTQPSSTSPKPATPNRFMQIIGLSRRSKTAAPSTETNSETEPLLDDAHSDQDEKDEKTMKEINQRRLKRAHRAAADANLLLINDAEDAHRRKIFALVFLVLAVGLAVPWALSRYVITSNLVDVWWKQSMFTLSVLLVILATTVFIPYLFPQRFLKNKPYSVQITYMVFCMVLMSVMLAVYVIFIQDPYVDSIILYATCFLIAMAVYCIVPVGRFHHGAAGLFAIVVMATIFFFVVVYPNENFTREFINRKLHASTITELQEPPPEEMLVNSVQLIGTLGFMLFVLYHMNHTSDQTYAHDPLFLAGQVYVMLIPSILICITPKYAIPGVAWKQ